MNVVPSLLIPNDPFAELDHHLMTNLTNRIKGSQDWNLFVPHVFRAGEQSIPEQFVEMMRRVNRRSNNNGKGHCIHAGLIFINKMRNFAARDETVTETLAWLRSNPNATELDGGIWSLTSKGEES